MEPEVAAFLKRIGWSIFLAFNWMVINSTFGIMLNWGFYVKRPTLGNYIFWIWAAGSLIALLLYLRRLWKQPLGWPEHPQHGWK